MKYYVAELVATGIAFLCALTNHAGACFLWRKLMRLDNWADDVLGRTGPSSPEWPPPHALKATHGPYQGQCTCYTARTAYSGTGSAKRYCPAHGMVDV